MENRTEQLTLALYEFVTCQRPDGTFYGNGGGKCHKGAESELPKYTNMVLGAKVNQVLEKHTPRLQKVFGEENISKTKDLLERFSENYTKYLSKIERGDLTPEDLETLYKGHHLTIQKEAEVAVYGMEPAGSWEGNPKGLAMELAFANSGSDKEIAMLSNIYTATVGGGKTFLTEDPQSGDFVFKIGDLMNELKSRKMDGSRGDMFYDILSGGGNFSPIPARGEKQKDWENTWGDLLRNQKRAPEFKDWETRASHDERFMGQRTRGILDEVRRSYQKGNLKIAVAFPGVRLNKSIKGIVGQHKSSGGRVFKTKGSVGEKGQVHNKDFYILEMAKGKYFVLSPSHPNVKGWRTSTVVENLRKMTAQAEAGLLEEI